MSATREDEKESSKIHLALKELLDEINTQRTFLVLAHEAARSRVEKGVSTVDVDKITARSQWQHSLSNLSNSCTKCTTVDQLYVLPF
jgi:hypothetical protein